MVITIPQREEESSMPDLNLLDDVSFEEESTPSPAPKKQKPIKQKGTGGGSSVLLLLLIIILVLGAVAYFLNQKGIIKLWGKKKAPITQIEEEPFPPLVQEEQKTVAPPQQHDTTQIALLDTSFVGHEGEDSKGTEKELEMSDRGDLASMEGEYTIQVIAFKEKKQAEEVRENLEIAGYPAFVEKVALKNGAWYRVCIGKYPTREDAKKAVLTFGSQLRSNYIIDKISQR